MVKLQSLLISADGGFNGSHRINRIGVSVFFALHGLTFATWASRIPTVQSMLQLNAAQLGLLLFMLPLGFFIGLPFAGWLNAKTGSRKATMISAILYSISLVFIGISTSTTSVAINLFLFGFFANTLNISMNTQAIEVEKLYQKRMMSTFHGLWSIGGFVGAGVGAWMSGRSISLRDHFMIISILFVVAIFLLSKTLIKKDGVKNGQSGRFIFPDKPLLLLGLVAFSSTIVEGAMFDWSNIFFKDVVKVSSEYEGLGYTSFMIAMATMRFLADGLTMHFGLKRILQLSGILAGSGLLIAVALPTIPFAVLAFVLVGTGVSSVAPMVYSTAGRSKTMIASSAITTVSSLGFVGFLIGPPLIGFIAGATSLTGAFLFLVIASVCVVTISSFVKE